MSLMLLAILAGLVKQESTASPSPPAPVQVGGQIKEPKKVKHVAPEYPGEALRAGLEGPVTLRCKIDPEGKIVDTRVLRGVSPLSDAAAKAVKEWRYTPTLSNGSAVPVVMTVTVNFRRDTHYAGPSVHDLLESLNSKNEFIRESATRLLGPKGTSAGVASGDKVEIEKRLRGVAEHDESERVRAAAAEALAGLEKQ